MGFEVNLDDGMQSNLASLLMDLEAILKDGVSSVLDFVPSMEGQVEIFLEGLPFLKSVFTGIPQDSTEGIEWILTVVKDAAAMAGSLNFLFYVNRMLGNEVSEKNLALLKFLEMIKLMKAVVFLMDQLKYKANLIVPGKGRISAIPSLYKCPKIDSFGFIDSLLGKLREHFTWRADLIACLKCQIEVFLEEFNFLRSFLWEIVDEHDEHQEFKDLDSCLGVNSFAFENGPIWCHMLWLFDIVKEIKPLKTLTAGIYTRRMYDKEEDIINQLTRGSMQLHIVSIVGMSGIGKTVDLRSFSKINNVLYFLNIT